MKPKSPLRNALGDSDNLNRLLELLSSQLEKGSFSVDASLAQAAREEFHLVKCQGEARLHEAQSMFRQFLPKPVVSSFVTKGYCPHHPDLEVASRFIIGKDIDPNIYNDVVRSPDQVLSDTYTPICNICEPGTLHNTSLSYTQDMSAGLLEYFETLEHAQSNYTVHEARVRGIQKLMMERLPSHTKMEYARVLGQLRRTKERANTSILEAEAAIRTAVQNGSDGIVVTSSRVKGSDRIGEKAAICLYYGKDLIDLLGIKVLSKENQGDYSPKEIFEWTKRELKHRFGGDPIYNQMDLTEKPVMIRGKPVFGGYKLWAWFGPQEENRTLISFQFQTYDDYVADQKDHPSYELRRWLELKDLEELGYNVEDLRRELNTVFNQSYKA